MEYRDVVRECSRLLVSQEAAVGFGNDMWSSSWLSEVMMVAACSEPRLFEDAVRMLIRVLMGSVFTEERIVSAIRKLLADLAEVKRDGGSLLSAVSTRVLCASKKKLPRGQSGDPGNDLHISIFKQEAFLRGLLKQIKDAEAPSVGKSAKPGVKLPIKTAPKGVGAIVTSLNAVRSALLRSRAKPGFLQIAWPEKCEETYAPDYAISTIAIVWDEEYELFERSSLKTPLNGKFVTSTAGVVAFPFPRVPYNRKLVDDTFGTGLLVSAEGVSAACMSMVVPCDIMKSKDFYAVTLLAELLSRSEGPLYTSIRGKGLAYDASIHVAIWTGQMSMEIHESSDPRQAMHEFLSVIARMETDVGWEEVVDGGANSNGFALETARASCAYKIVTAKSTASACIVSSLRACLRGFLTTEEAEEHEKTLYSITQDDLKSAYIKYFRQFLDPSQRITFVITGTGETVAPLRESFKKISEKDIPSGVTVDSKAFVADLNIVSLNDLKF
ncbi:hypothetical protein HDU76_008865 [Blyttiomyces sp. JEL0837]|nr:hypothetical protein HDU76_008865 [Blyttiomyces sp. JEL0837]